MKRLILLIVWVLITASVFADIKTKAAQEAAEWILKKFAREAGEETLETLTQKLLRLASRYGDDAVAAVRKIGPRGLRVISEAGEHAPKAIRLIRTFGDDALSIVAKPQGMAIFVRYGDDAAKAMIKHSGVSSPLIKKFGRPGINALSVIDSRNARRLAMMANDGMVKGEILPVIARYGDSAMDFIWRHKGALAGGALLTAFLLNPEPYINGTVKLTKTVASTAVEPLAKGAEKAVGTVNWTLVLMAVLFLLAAKAFLMRRKRTSRK